VYGKRVSVSRFRPDGEIESSDVGAAGDGQQLRSAGSPAYTVIVAGGTEDGPDAARLVGEVITRVIRFVDVIEDAAPIGMNQPAQEQARVFSRDVTLPRAQLDRSLVLRARPMLREQTWPVFPGSSDDDASPRTGVTHGSRTCGRHCARTFGDDVRILCVEADSQEVNVAAVPG